MTELPGTTPGPGRTGLRIVLYYAALGVALVLLLLYVPGTEELITLGVLGSADSGGEITRTMAGGIPVEGGVPTGWRSVWVTALSVLGALLIMIPVAWTYILIKRDQGYEESVVHTLLILPVAVAGIVTIVQGSLALAFSLAGIVAAVRFRTTLEDTKDAVYVFLAIGVGLAAGVQALGVAIALSVVFNVVNLILWKMNFGNIYADQLTRTGGLGLGTVIAGPASSRSALGWGDRTAARTAAPESLAEIAETQERVQRLLRSESDIKKERKQYSALLLFTRDVPAVQAAVEPVLQEWSLRWQLAEVRPCDDGPSALTYLVRLRAGAVEQAFLGALREVDDPERPMIEAAELRSLKEMAKRA